MNTMVSGSNDKKNSTSNSAALNFVNNTMTRQRGEKRTNEQDNKSIENATLPVPGEPTNAAAAANPTDPGLVEKLMQQLNDLKEMVCML